MRTHKASDNTLTVLFNKTCVQLLSLLYNNIGKSFYLREITRKVNMGVGTVQRELSKLVSSGLVVRQVNGRQVYYAVNIKSPVFTEIHGLVIKTFGLADVIRDVLLPLSAEINYAFIYGSQADGTSSTDSDIDLMVIGQVSEMELHRAINKVENKLNKSINYSLFTLAEFGIRKKEKKGFINRIISVSKIMLIGDENEIR